MHDAQLNLGLREHGVDGFRKTLEPIDAGNEDILHPTVLEFGDHLQPELRPLCLLDLEAKDFLEAVDGDADGQVHGLVDDVPLVLDLDHQGIQVQDRIHGIKRAVLPLPDILHDGIGDAGNELKEKPRSGRSP